MKKYIIGLIVFLSALLPFITAAQSTLIQGGTGWGTSTPGDLLVGTSSTLRYSRLPLGPINSFLGSSGTSTLYFSSSSLASILNIPALPLSVANGGFGQSMAAQTLSSGGAQNAVAAGRIRVTGSPTFNGIVAPSPASSVITYIYNISGGTITINNQSTSATAANRIVTSGGGNMTVANNSEVTLVYDVTSSRWRVLSQNLIATILSPLVISSTNALSIPVSTNSVNGFLSSSDHTLFSNKPSGSGATSSVAYWANPNSLTGNASEFYFDPSSFFLGVQTNTPMAAGHFVANTGQKIAAPIASAVLTQFSPIDPPATYSVTQVPGHLYAPDSFLATESGSGGGYNDGDSIDYRITAYNDDSGRTFSIVNSQTNVFVTTSPTSDTDLNWDDNTTGSSGISGYIIERQINGGGYNDQVDVGITTNFHDDGTTGWVSNSTLTPTFPDFVANSSSRDYKAFTIGSLPDSSTGYSQSSNDETFTDDNSGTPYGIQHDISDNSRVLSDGFATSVFDHYNDGMNFTEYTDTFQAGNTVTPNTFGTVSDSVSLTHNFDFFNYRASPLLYSFDSTNSSTEDPDDGNTYYFVFNFSGVIDGVKINADSTAGKTLTSSGAVWDGTSSFFTEDTVVTPNSIDVPGTIAEAHGSSLSDVATGVFRSLDGEYSRIEGENSSSTRRWYLQNLSSTTAALGFGSTDVIKWGENILGFFGASPVSQQTGNILTGLSNLGLFSSPTLPTPTKITATGSGPTAGIGNTASITASCTGSLKVYGGGGSISGNADGAVLQNSFPTSTTMWQVDYYATLGLGAAGTITAYALCN